MYTKDRLFVLAVIALLFVACTQPAAPRGLQIVDPWLRPEAMVMAEPPATDAMTMTMHGAHAMTMTAGMTATQPMTGGMGMGMGGATGALYMVIRNPGNQPDRLLKATSDVAKALELHSVIEENNVMAMRAASAIDVPAQGEVVLKPGSFHIMLIGLTRALQVGDTVTVTLTFEQAGALTVQAKVRER